MPQKKKKKLHDRKLRRGFLWGWRSGRDTRSLLCLRETFENWTVQIDTLVKPSIAPKVSSSSPAAGKNYYFFFNDHYNYDPVTTCLMATAARGPRAWQLDGRYFIGWDERQVDIISCVKYEVWVYNRFVEPFFIHCQSLVMMYGTWLSKHF